MRRARKRQAELNDYVVGELKELRQLIQQANSDHAEERAETRRQIEALDRVVQSRTDHLA